MVCSKALSNFYDLYTHSQHSGMHQELFCKKRLFFKAPYKCKRTQNIFLFSMFVLVSVKDDWYTSVLLLSTKPDWDTEIFGVVKKKWSTMLIGTFEKKRKENVAWQLRSWSEILVGFSHNVVTAPDCRADGKELDFKQCTN